MKFKKFCWFSLRSISNLGWPESFRTRALVEIIPLLSGPKRVKVSLTWAILLYLLISCLRVWISFSFESMFKDKEEISDFM